MPLTKLVFKPGVNREGTNYANEGTFWDGDKIRFKSGFPEKIGGWVPYSADTFLGSCTSLWAYSCTCGTKLLGVGTDLKVYVERGGEYFDITPIVSTATIASNAFTTDTATPTILVVNDNGHGLSTGSFVIISTVSGPINGVPDTEINGDRQVTVIDPNKYSIAITTAPTSSGTTGAATIERLVAAGLPYYIAGSGWGAGAWSRGTWGSGTDTVVSLGQIRIWGMANYGNALVFGPRGGALYYWDFDYGSGMSQRGELIAGMVGANDVPVAQNGVLVSDQRFVITFGSNDYGSTDLIPMLVRWSDQENYLEWEPRATTQAGSQILTNGSFIVTAKSARQEILIWTDSALHSMQYVGPPYVYGFNLLADGISIIGPNAAVVTNGIAFWMGKDKFYVYDGRVQPLPSAVRTYVFEDLDQDDAWQVVAGTNEGFNEVWWLYASKGSLTVNKYVIFNYVENTWAFGTLDRTFWYDTGLKTYPIAATYNPDTQVGNLMYHEVGNDDGTTNPPSPIYSFVETADFDLEDGTHFSFVDRMIPDLTFVGSDNGENIPAPQVALTVQPRRFPGSNYTETDDPTVTRTASIPVEQYTEQVFIRARGRQMRFKIESDRLGTRWQLGVPRLNMRPDGRK